MIWPGWTPLGSTWWTNTTDPIGIVGSINAPLTTYISRPNAGSRCGKATAAINATVPASHARQLDERAICSAVIRCGEWRDTLGSPLGYELRRPVRVDGSPRFNQFWELEVVGGLLGGEREGCR